LGTRDAVLDSKVGGTGEIGFQDQRTVTKVRIDELEPPVHVAWTTISPNVPGGWRARRLPSTCERRGDTVLSFAHHGFD
jgi:hypothetical protein